MIFRLFLLLFVLSLVAMLAFMGIWTYFDARKKGLNPLLWTFIVLLGQNFIGLIIYLLVGRKEEKIFCYNCKTIGLKRSKYCHNCGVEFERETKPKIEKTNRFLIAFIISVVIFVVSTVGFALSLVFDENLPIWNGVSIGKVENNFGKKWDVSFKTSGEILQETINLNLLDSKMLYFTGNCEEGTMTFHIVKNDTILTYDVSAQTEQLSVDLSEFGDGKITLMLYNDNAKNASFKSYWE